MIFDPDLPREQARTSRQSLIRTDRGWGVLGQPTAEAEAWFKRAREEIGGLGVAQLCDPLAVDMAASKMAFDLVAGGLI